MMKQIYSKPELKIIFFSDVVMTSDIEEAAPDAGSGGQGGGTIHAG